MRLFPPLARAAFNQLGKVWRSSKISRKTKIRLFNACVKSVLLYGCETWKATAGLIKKLQTFINRCLRVSSEWDGQIESGMKISGKEHVRSPLKRISREEDGAGLVILWGSQVAVYLDMLLNGIPKVREARKDHERHGEGVWRRRW